MCVCAHACGHTHLYVNVKEPPAKYAGCRWSTVLCSLPPTPSVYSRSSQGVPHLYQMARGVPLSGRAGRVSWQTRSEGVRGCFFFFFFCFRPLRLDVLMLLFYFMFFLLHALPTALSPSLWCFMFVFSFIGMWKKKYNNLAADQIVSLQQFRPSRGSGRGWIFSVAASPGS